MSIVFYDVEDWERERIPDVIAGEEVQLMAEQLTAQTAKRNRQARIISIFAWSKVTDEVLEALPNLEHIATRSTGFDHIDMKACRDRGISVSNVPTYGERTVAEHTIAMILALSRKLLQAEKRGREGKFSREGLRGFDLDDKTLGLVGCGKIGSKVAEIARAFAMRVIVFDPNPDKELAKKLDIKYVDSLEELLKRSDVISLHAPLTDETRQMINMETVKLIKPGAILVNTARGDLVQTAAILKALDDGILSGVGLDVIENEQLVEEEAEVLSKSAPSNKELSALLHNHILFSNPKVIVTPHNAFNSEEAVSKILNTAIWNIDAFLSKTCLNVVE